MSIFKLPKSIPTTDMLARRKNLDKLCNKAWRGQNNDKCSRNQWTVKKELLPVQIRTLLSEKSRVF